MTATESTEPRQIEEFVPREIDKIQVQIENLNSEIETLKELSVDMSNDLVEGIGSSQRAIEFRSSMQQEQSKLDQEVIRLIN